MVVLFSTAILLSAALVFMVQPMIAKAVLPTFGGTPQVWTASMLFFQAALLAGYGYSHVATRRLAVRPQAAIHVVVMLLPLLVLPIALRGVDVVDGAAPALAVVGILALSVGLPYVVASTTSPLIQRWFSLTGHRHAADPYFLYAASNVGSLAGLLAYPFLVEPNLRLADQGLLWSIGYALFIVAAAACAVVVARTARAAPAPADLTTTDVAGDPQEAEVAATDVAPTWRRRATWVFKAFIPSSLLLGVTTHVQTDVAAVPLLWVIPLSLYLLTFIVAFSPRRPFGPAGAARVLPFAVVLTVLTFFRVIPLPIWANVAIHDITFFIAAMVAHGQLADDRPSPRHLTGFYLLLAVGGALGGIFNALIAPLVFDQVLEYPLLLVIALLLRQARSRPERTARQARRALLTDLVVPALYLVVLLAGLAYLPLGEDGAAVWATLVTGATLVTVPWPRRFALATGAVLAVTFLSSAGGLFADRTFFGVNRVIEDDAGRHIYLSGATIHGVQRWEPGGGRQPLSYYHPTGPAGQLFDRFRSDPAVTDVAIIGLGAGGLAAYNEAHQRYVFYEIDPVVVDIARDPTLFTFLADAPGTVEVIEGDGRLEIERAPDASYDVIVLDAFSSDAIPAHLVTREAIGVYLAKLKPGGVLVANVSNAYLDVASVVAAAAAANDLAGFVRTDADLDDVPAGDKEASSWIAASRERAPIAHLESDERWVDLSEVDRGNLWTDDFSDILSVIR